jgi:hypothetical protein
LAQFIKKEFKASTNFTSSDKLGMALHIQKKCIDVAIFDTYNTQILHLGNYVAENGLVDGDFLSAVLKSYAQYSCVQHIAAIDESRFIVVPNIFESTEELHELFCTQHFVEANEAILEQSLPWQNFTALYAAKQATMQLLHHLLPHVQLRHAQVCNLQEYLASNLSNAIYVHTTDQFFTLTVITNKLVLHNAYVNNTEVDIVLQIQKAIEVYAMIEPSIFVSGRNAVENLKSISVYFKQTQKVALPKSILYLNAIDAESSHEFYTLYNIVKACAS